VDYYVQYHQFSGYNISSLGYLTRAANTTNGKWSWQVAEFKPVCPVYGYYLSNATIHPQFHGYCVDADKNIDFATLAYNGVDYGLKQEEQQLLDGVISETFLPKFELLGEPTLTYEVKRNQYVSFADVNLNSLSRFVAENITFIDGNSLWIRDDATDDIIAQSRKITGGYIQSFPTQYPGLQWTTYVAKENIYEDMNRRILVACVVSFVFVFLVGFIVYFMTLYWIIKPLQEKNHYTPYTDLKNDDF